MKKIINIWLWKQPIYLLWDSTPEEYNELTKKIWEEDEQEIEYCVGSTTLLDSGWIILYVRWVEDKQKMLTTLNHEIFHVTERIFEIRWVDFDSETYAYTMEFLQSKCYKAIWLKINFNL